MQPRRRQSPAPRERNPQAPRHPTGNARRRWPRAYDGGVPIHPRPPTRYRRAYDGASDRRVEEGVRLPARRTAMSRIRKHPIRHGLIGLGIAGASVPIAVGRQNTALRTDPSHEQTLAHGGTATRISDSAVTRAWRNAIADSAELLGATEATPVSAAEEGTAKGAAHTTAAREAKIQANLDKYKSYDVPRDLAESIYDLALQSDIDPDMAFGLVRTESAFKSSATSHVGAMGLTQLMPATARWLEPGTTNSDLRNPDVNLRIGFRYLRDLIDKYDGNTRLALLAYNRGPGTVDRILKKGGDPNNGYADMVLRGKAH